MTGKKQFLLILSLLFISIIIGNKRALAEEVMPDLLLDDPSDMQVLMEELEKSENSDIKPKKDGLTLTDEEETASDDLESLRDDLGDIEFMLPDEIEKEKQLLGDKLKAKKTAKPSDDESKAKKSGIKPIIVNDDAVHTNNKFIFDIGREEKELLNVAEKMQGQIPNQEWNEVVSSTSISKYKVRTDDWLWKISKKLFGSGFYYAKIWSLNSYITNPHEIEPGMVLAFNTGSDSGAPEIRLGSFTKTDVKKGKGVNKHLAQTGFDKWGDNSKPGWLDEKKSLQAEGAFVQYATDKNMKDLEAASEQGLIDEYESYEPKRVDVHLQVPRSEYDSTGFDKNVKMTHDFKEGYYLTTFLSTNIVQDYGKIDSAIEEGMFIREMDNCYLKFDERVDVMPGDRFSIYSAAGEVSHINSDRKGYKYTIVGQVRIISKHGDLWEGQVFDLTGVVQRDDRITVYTPKIERITQTFNSRLVEAGILGAYSPMQAYASYGDVVYLDRGRADGVEMGNVFEMYGFKDRGTKKNITENPSYKNGELTVITITDNFSTALVTQSRRDFKIGDIGITKTKEAAARATKLKEERKNGSTTRVKEDALDELDVELNLDKLNDSLLDKADQIEFTEDELAELERQEREKSILTDGERDLRALERLEKEIETAEKMLNEARLDEDKLLENQNLNDIEKKLLYQEQESLDEIEENFGKNYMDEDINDKENPYGLTEFDIEEIDELLNIEKKDN